MSDKNTLIAILASVLVSISLVFVSTIVNPKHIDAILFGLVGLILSFQMSEVFIRRNDSKKEKAHSRVISDETGYMFIKHLDWFLGSKSDSGHLEVSSVFKRRYKELPARIREELDSLIIGEIIENDKWREPQFTREVIEIARTSLKAVSNQGLAFWQSSQGAVFLKSNTDKVNNGINIERVFIYSEEDLEAYRTIVKQQTSQGIKCWLVCIDDINKDMVADFILIDDEFVRFGRNIDFNSGSREAVLTRTPSQVRQYSLAYETLKELGEYIK